MLPHFVGEKIVEEEKIDQPHVSSGNCIKNFVELNHYKYMTIEEYIEVVLSKTEEKNFVFEFDNVFL